MLEAILSSLPQLAGENSGHDRRRLERYNCSTLPLLFLVRPCFRCQRGVLRDASAKGLSFYSRTYLEPGSLLAIQLRSQQHGVSGILSGRVVHITLEDSNWVVGCELSRNLDDVESAVVRQESLVS